MHKKLQTEDYKKGCEYASLFNEAIQNAVYKAYMAGLEEGIKTSKRIVETYRTSACDEETTWHHTSSCSSDDRMSHC